MRKLQASICELDRSLGWQGAAAEQRFDPLDVHGAVAWQPSGTQRAAPRPRGRPGSASPLLLGGGSPGSGSGGSMSLLSRRIMESSGAGGSFLERLERDIEQRQAARAVRQARAGRYTGGTAEQLAEREQERRDLSLVRWAVPCSACNQTLMTPACGAPPPPFLRAAMASLCSDECLLFAPSPPSHVCHPAGRWWRRAARSWLRR